MTPFRRRFRRLMDGSLSWSRFDRGSRSTNARLGVTDQSHAAENRYGQGLPPAGGWKLAMQEDPTEYSPEFQDEYRRLWHEAAAERDHYLEALRRIANNEFGDTFVSLEHVARVALQSTTVPDQPPQRSGMSLRQRLEEVGAFACDVTDGALDDEWYLVYKWMEKVTAEIERLACKGEQPICD